MAAGSPSRLAGCGCYHYGPVLPVGVSQVLSSPSPVGKGTKGMGPPHVKGCGQPVRWSCCTNYREPRGTPPWNPPPREDEGMFLREGKQSLVGLSIMKG